MARKKATDIAQGDRIAGKGRVIGVDRQGNRTRGYGWYDEATERGETVVIKDENEEVEVEDGNA